LQESFNELEDVKERVVLENDLAYAFLTNKIIVSGCLVFAQAGDADLTENKLCLNEN
jgi:hypothetical protein